MALVNVIHCCLNSIRQISEDLKDAIIYLDAGCTESFQLLGAFPLLLELGVHAVCSLESMSPLDVVAGWNSQLDPARKIVVITTRLLSDAHRYILRCLSTHQNVCRCTIYTSISEVAHSTYPDSPLGPDAFHEYETLLVQDYMELNKRSETKSGLTGDTELKEGLIEEEGWAQLSSIEEDISNFASISNVGDSSENAQILHEESEEPKLVVSVLHFPMILCPLSPRVFVLPSEGTVTEAYLCSQHESSISPGLPSLGTKSGSDSEDIPPGASLTAQLLYHLAIKMDLKLEIFSLGGLSKTIGKLLTDMSSLYDVGRRKRSAGLLLIDRTLDLRTPCSHGDSLVDRIYSSLPRRQHSSSGQSKGSQSQLKDGPVKLRRDPLDVKIPLADILSEEDSSTDNFGLLNGVDAFLRGWNSFKSDSPINELIDLSKKCQAENSISSDGEVFSGSFVSTDSFHGTPYLEALLDRKTKDGTMLIKKWLLETLRKENLSGKLKVRPGFPSRSDLRTMIKALVKSQSSLIRNKGIVQTAAATLYAMEESHSAKWDAFASAEKILTVNAGDTSQSLAAQMSDLINKSCLLQSQGNKPGTLSQGLISFQDALLLIISGYILAGENFPTSGSGGPFSWQEEHFMKEAIVDAVLENPEVGKFKFLLGLAEELEANIEKNKVKQTNEESSEQIDDFDDDQWGAWGDEDNNKQEVYSDMQLKLDLRDRVDNLFKFLHKLSGLKTNISSILGPESNYSGDLYSSKGLLHKILTRVLSKYDIPGMEYHSSTVGRLFKSGFGRFGIGQAKPSLADQSVILVFIVGGFSAVEVREAQEALSESGRPEIELMLGGTTLLTPNDMFELLLGESSYT
ncbi:sec1 family domain-containing protein MIP3 [Apium graveolens]|uniref:sec1 family domain-containing protein MIP3 n=1 Tax=Apium graveolens TaxID=4045 RepID=UPI003D796DE2